MRSFGNDPERSSKRPEAPERDLGLPRRAPDLQAEAQVNWRDDAVDGCKAVLMGVLRSSPALLRSEVDGLRPAVRHLKRLAHSPSVGLALYHAGHVLAYGEQVAPRCDASVRQSCNNLRGVMARAPAPVAEEQTGA